MKGQDIKMSNADLVAQCLKRHGVEYIFGQSNPTKITLACMDVGIRQVAYRQENTGSYMAQAYGMATRRVPVVTAQNGPAATLLVPGLAECLKASHPIVALVQQVSTGDFERNAFQELDHEMLFMGCAKWVKTVYSPDRIEDYIDMAFTQATSGKPGPAVLLFPADLFNGSNDVAVERTIYRTSSINTCPLDRCVPERAKLQEAVELIMRAERPVIYAGGGVISSRAQTELRRIQQELVIPVATTMMGKGAVDETHPLSLGVAGYISGKRGMAQHQVHLIQDADLVILIGNRTNQNGTDSWTLLPRNATYIHIDVDPNEIGRNYEAMRLVGDAKATLTALYEELKGHDLSARQVKRQELEQVIAKGKQEHLADIQDVTTLADCAPIKPERLMVELNRHLDPDHILVADASFSSIWIANYIEAKQAREFYFPRGLAGLGWGLPMAMGVKVAAPNRKVFCLTGDGGFAHAWSELETCKREGIDVVCAVLNNTILGYQYHAEESRWGRHTNACEMLPVDYKKLAESCGLTGLRLDDPSKITQVLEQATAASGTVIIDVIADLNALPPVSLFHKSLPQT